LTGTGLMVLLNFTFLLTGICVVDRCMMMKRMKYCCLFGFFWILHVRC